MFYPLPKFSPWFIVIFLIIHGFGRFVNTLLKTLCLIPVVYPVIVFYQLKRFRPGHRVFCRRERIRNDEKRESPKKNTALQVEAAVAGLCNRSYTNE